MKLKALIFGILSLGMLFVLNCKTQTKPEYVFIRPETNPNTVLRKLEIDQIKVGDKMIKAEAVMGKATEIRHTEAGSEYIWWFIPTTYSNVEYETLKTKPSNTEGVKFVKLTADPKGNILSKTFEL